METKSEQNTRTVNIQANNTFDWSALNL